MSATTRRQFHERMDDGDDGEPLVESGPPSTILVITEVDLDDPAEDPNFDPYEEPAYVADEGTIES